MRLWGGGGDGEVGCWGKCNGCYMGCKSANNDVIAYLDSGRYDMTAFRDNPHGKKIFGNLQ